MRVPIRLVCLLWALVAFAALPAGASAKPHSSVRPKSLHLSFRASASKGYSVSVRTDGHRQVNVEVVKDDFIGIYKALGHVSRKGIEADLGRFGKVSLRFRSKSGPKRVKGLPLPPPLREDCRGRRPVSETGVFVGNLRFEGEHGYTRVVAHRLAGRVTRSYKRICRPSDKHKLLDTTTLRRKDRPRPESLLLSAVAKEHGVGRFFATAAIEIEPAHGKHPAEGLSIDVAVRGEKVEDVAVLKLILLFDDGVSLTASPRRVKPVTVEATPSDPFVGTGSYLEAPGQSPSWSGTLGIRMPGNGVVPLAGPEFEVEFCRAISEREFDKCSEPTLPRPLREPFRALLSGKRLPLPTLG